MACWAANVGNQVQVEDLNLAWKLSMQSLGERMQLKSPVMLSLLDLIERFFKMIPPHNSSSYCSHSEQLKSQTWILS